MRFLITKRVSQVLLPKDSKTFVWSERTELIVQREIMRKSNMLVKVQKFDRP